MTKDKFVELIRRSIPTSHNPALVDGYISFAYNSFVKMVLKPGNIYNEYYTKMYEGVSVTKEADNDFYYSDLPAKILALMKPGSGVWIIESSGSPALTFVPIPDMNYKTISNLSALKIPSYIPYAVYSTKVQYRVKIMNIETVNMRLFVQFDEYDSTDDINLPDGVDIKIRELVINYLQQKLPEING